MNKILLFLFSLIIFISGCNKANNNSTNTQDNTQIQTTTENKKSNDNEQTTSTNSNKSDKEKILLEKLKNDSKRVGNQDSGYINIPNKFVDFKEDGVSAPFIQQWSDISTKNIITMSTMPITADMKNKSEKYNIKISELIGYNYAEDVKNKGATYKLIALEESDKFSETFFITATDVPFDNQTKDMFTILFVEKNNESSLHTLTVEISDEQYSDILFTYLTWSKDQ